MVSTPEHVTEHLLEVRVFHPVDDGVDGAVEDDDRPSPWDDRITGRYHQSNEEGSQTGNKGAHHKEEILGDLYLSLAEASRWFLL